MESHGGGSPDEGSIEASGRALGQTPRKSTQKIALRVALWEQLRWVHHANKIRFHPEIDRDQTRRSMPHLHR